MIKLFNCTTISFCATFGRVCMGGSHIISTKSVLQNSSLDISNIGLASFQSCVPSDVSAQFPSFSHTPTLVHNGRSLINKVDKCLYS